MLDVVSWPCDDRDLAVALANAADRAEARIEAAGHDDWPVFAQSPAMRHALDAAGAAARARGGVSLCGEPGSGRELLARTIHALADPDGAAPFVGVECASDVPRDVERRLFGSAVDPQVDAPSGRAACLGEDAALLAARGGTLFLANVVELPGRVQAALARLLRDREALAADGRTVVELDLRVMAAFDPDVDGAVADGRLRGDLLDRLSQTRVDLPALRRRREDIPLLAAWFLARACGDADVPPKSFSRSALALLAALPWYGNADELRSLVDLAVQTVAQPVIQLDDLLEHASLDGMSARIEAGVSLRDAKARFERDCITAVLRRHHGRVGEAAKALGIQRTNLYRKVRQLNVSRALLSARR
jgi:DNA-binding NtrC family response regulator